MNVREYLDSRGMKLIWFAKEVGVSPRTIYNIIEGLGASKPVAYRIEHVTNGLVPAHTIMKIKEK